MVTKTIEQVDNAKKIFDVAKLAREIWTEHYNSIIGREQVQYMLDNFQSIKAIGEQIEKGAEYYLLMFDEEKAGYLALVPDKKDSGMMLSKIYVKSDYRGRKGGTYLLNFAKKAVKERNMSKIWMRVNKDNTSTIKWYKRHGFEIIQEDKQDIGAGFCMDDYIMQLILI